MRGLIGSACLGLVVLLTCPPGARAEHTTPDRVGGHTHSSPPLAKPQPPAAPPVKTHGTKVPRVFLDCTECSVDYYRQQLNYFDWVRDRYEADFALSIVTRNASNGGSANTITLRHPKQPSQPNIVRVVTTQPGDQELTIRELLVDAMLRCLYEALRGTPHERAFTLELPRREVEALDAVVDGWDHWVFGGELLGELNAENNMFFLKLDGLVNIRRITETSKFRSTTRYSRRTSSFTLEDDERVTGFASSLMQRLLYAHSIGHHWALGAMVAGMRDQPDNMKLHIHGGPVLEYNVFPYEENASHQLRFAYQVGAWYSHYFERTILGRRRETRPYHALSVVLDLNEAWGSVQLLGQANSFINEPSLWRFTAGINFSVSVVAGLALTFTGEASWIEDQISLRGRDLTDREIFLETSELQKNFNITSLFGFSYTFGSVHNTIVNPRFGRVDFDEDD
ncbi:MAG: hypothetical protein ABW321_30725 [Polyangiales bacterium]